MIKRTKVVVCLLAIIIVYIISTFHNLKYVNGCHNAQESEVDREFNSAILAHPSVATHSVNAAVSASQRDSSPMPKYIKMGRVKKPKYNLNLDLVARKAGFVQATSMDEDWRLLWAWNLEPKDLPSFDRALQQLKPYQKVNQVPGLDKVLSKKQLVTSGVLPGVVPKAFQLPKELSSFKQYLGMHPNKTFLQKSNDHQKGIIAVKMDGGPAQLSALSTDENMFLQEMVDRPLLVDGRKFDVAVHVIVTSVNPLRVYMYDNLFVRFCYDEYYPFDPKVTSKYLLSVKEKRSIASSNQVPTWQGYLNRQLSQLEALKETIRAHSKDPEAVLSNLRYVIGKLFLENEAEMIRAIEKYPRESSRSFFQHMRLDMMLDEQFNWYLIEVNGSPFTGYSKLSAGRQEARRQMLHGMLKMIGVFDSIYNRDESMEYDWNIKVPDQAITVFHQACSASACEASNSQEGACQKNPQCQLCPRCLGQDDKRFLKEAVNEQAARQLGFLRAFPEPPGTQEQARGQLEQTFGPREMSLNNWKMRQWYLGKCLIDASWCH